MDKYIEELEKNLDDINALIRNVRIICESNTPPMDPMAAQYADGKLMLAPLVAAKSTTLAALISAYQYRLAR